MAEQKIEQESNELQVKKFEYYLSPIGQDTKLFEMVQRKATMYAASAIVPDMYKNNIPNCAIAVDMATRMNANPLMVMQNLYIVHGQPSFSSKFLIAALNATGRFSPLDYIDNGKSDDEYGFRATATRLSDGKQLIGPEVTMAMAKKEGWATKSGSKWQTMPELMLRYRAAAFFQRLFAPEVSMGFLTAEEAEDIGPKTIDVECEDLTEKVQTEAKTEEVEVELPAADNTEPSNDKGTNTAKQTELPIENPAEQKESRKPAFGATK